MTARHQRKPPDASREPRGAECIIENGPRERVLSDDELATIWNALDDGGDYAPLLRLLMLTGARREEIAGLRWSEIDPEAALVRLPGERTKNGRPHDIPLVPQALAILKARQRQEGRDFVFGTNGRGFVDFSGSRADFDQRLNGAIAQRWTLAAYCRSAFRSRQRSPRRT